MPATTEHINVNSINFTPALMQLRQKTGTVERPHQKPVTIDESLAKMRKRRIRTADGMRRYLTKENAVEYIPRTRVLIVPKKQFEESDGYNRYLRKRTFLDRYEYDHNERKAWHKEMGDTIDNSLIADVCINDNQLTGGSITGLFIYTDILIRRAFKVGNFALHDALNLQKEKFRKVFAGSIDAPTSQEAVSDISTDASNLLLTYSRERYRRLSYNDKLAIVHGFCDTIAETLWVLAAYGDEMPIVTKIHVTGNRRHVK